MTAANYKWNTYFTYSMLPMLYVGCDFHILAANEVMRELIGYSKEDLLQMNLTEILVEDINSQLEQLIFKEQYHSILMKLHLLDKAYNMTSVSACLTNYYSMEGHFEESLIIFNLLGQDFHSKQGLWNSLMNPSIKN